MCMATTQEGGGHRGPEPAMWAGGAARVGKNEEGGPSCKQEVFPDAPDPCLHLPVWVSPPGSLSCPNTVLRGALHPIAPPESLSPLPLTLLPHRPSGPPMTPAAHSSLSQPTVCPSRGWVQAQPTNNRSSSAGHQAAPPLLQPDTVSSRGPSKGSQGNQLPPINLPQIPHSPRCTITPLHPPAHQALVHQCFPLGAAPLPAPRG